MGQQPCLPCGRGAPLAFATCISTAYTLRLACCDCCAVLQPELMERALLAMEDNVICSAVVGMLGMLWDVLREECLAAAGGWWWAAGKLNYRVCVHMLGDRMVGWPFPRSLPPALFALVSGMLAAAVAWGSWKLTQRERKARGQVEQGPNTPGTCLCIHSPRPCC